MNAVNAILIEGHTLMSLIHPNFGQKSKQDGLDDADSVHKLTADQLTRLKLKIPPHLVKIIIIDEISNIPPYLIAALDSALRQLMECEEDFGGIPIIFVGDMNQTSPVRAISLTKATMMILENEETMYKMQNRFKPKNKREVALEKKLSRFKQTSPFYMGCKLFNKARWFKLTEQMRANETEKDHLELLTKMEKGIPLTIQDITQYQNLSVLDFEEDEEWWNAPVLVSTNRERISINSVRAKAFAQHYGEVVFRWLNESKKWAQKPKGENAWIEAVNNDDGFFEYFVPQAKGFVTDNICTELHIANGTSIQLHSITPVSKNVQTVFQTGNGWLGGKFSFQDILQ